MGGRSEVEHDRDEIMRGKKRGLKYESCMLNISSVLENKYIHNHEGHVLDSCIYYRSSAFTFMFIFLHPGQNIRQSGLTVYLCFLPIC